jgi:hypothetical protein
MSAFTYSVRTFEEKWAVWDDSKNTPLLKCETLEEAQGYLARLELAMHQDKSGVPPTRKHPDVR